jgi:hypothetical protein
MRSFYISILLVTFWIGWLLSGKAERQLFSNLVYRDSVFQDTLIWSLKEIDSKIYYMEDSSQKTLKTFELSKNLSKIDTIEYSSYFDGEGYCYVESYEFKRSNSFELWVQIPFQIDPPYRFKLTPHSGKLTPLVFRAIPGN